MRIGFNGNFLKWDVCHVIDEVEERIHYYGIKPSEVRKGNIFTCFYEIFETFRFLKEPENYQNAGINGRKSLANSLIKWRQLDPENNQIDEWIRIWEYEHGGLF